MAEAAVSAVRDAVAATSALPEAKRKRPITDPVEKRADLINAYYDLPGDIPPAMREIRDAISAAAKALAAIEKRLGKEHCDTGRMIHALDLLQQAKNAACDALILPHAHYPIDA